MIELPYVAAFYVTRFCMKCRRKKRRHTVNVTSPASYMVWPSAAVHIAARQALKGFSDALRLEAAPGDILASLVVPRLVESTHWE